MRVEWAVCVSMGSACRMGGVRKYGQCVNVWAARVGMGSACRMGGVRTYGQCV